MKLELAYAQALAESVKGKNAAESEKVLKNFRALVEMRGHAGLFHKIAKAYGNIESKSAAKKTVSITVPAGAKVEIPKHVEKVFEEALGKDIHYSACEDDTLIGGFVAEGGGVRVDESHKSGLLSLYQKIKQNQ
jgi:F0F1-type ATP synthase delta subunit